MTMRALNDKTKEKRDAGSLGKRLGVSNRRAIAGRVSYGRAVAGEYLIVELLQGDSLINKLSQGESLIFIVELSLGGSFIGEQPFPRRGKIILSREFIDDARHIRENSRR